MVYDDKDIVIIPRDQIDAWLMVINAAERFVVMSGDIISAARTGEPYEVLVRQLTNLHANLQALAELAGEAKQCQITVPVLPDINGQDVAQIAPVSFDISGSVEQMRGVG